MRTFTLDTNCIIAIDEGRPEAPFVRTLADAHTAGKAHVAVVAVSRADKRQIGSYLDNLDAFRDRLASIDLGHLDILKPMGYFDISFEDWCIPADDTIEALEKQIHGILFPQFEFTWQDHCDVNDIDPALSPHGDWRNCKCDVQLMWTHIHNKRDVFVTAEDNFHKPEKKSALVALGAGHIERPAEAVSLISL